MFYSSQHSPCFTETLSLHCTTGLTFSGFPGLPTCFSLASLAMRQRSIVEFCRRHDSPQPSTAVHGNSPVSIEDAEVSPTASQAPQTQEEPASPLSFGSSRPSPLFNPNTGLQLCTSISEFMALLWLSLTIGKRIALQGSSYFINSDFRWYIKQLPAVVASQSSANEEAESEPATEDEVLHSDSEANTVYSTLPRKAG